jgi:hypothetical protein
MTHAPTAQRGTAPSWRASWGPVAIHRYSGISWWTSHPAKEAQTGVSLTMETATSPGSSSAQAPGGRLYKVRVVLTGRDPMTSEPTLPGWLQEWHRAHPEVGLCAGGGDYD